MSRNESGLKSDPELTEQLQRLIDRVHVLGDSVDELATVLQWMFNQARDQNNDHPTIDQAFEQNSANPNPQPMTPEEKLRNEEPESIPEPPTPVARDLF